MPSYDPSLFNVNPYYDDFSEDKKFLRMLFRPGYAVQSRELTQLQTVLQNQIERFGNHIFKDGSRIIGGEISTQTLNFVRVFPQTQTSPIFTITSSDLVGYNLIQTDENGNIIAKAKVVDYLPSYSAADPYGVAVVSYMSGTQFTAGTTIASDNPDKVMQLKVSPASTAVPPVGKCRIVATSEGIYYVSGFFVKTDNQLDPAYTISNEIRNFVSPTGIMGFDVQSTIITEKDDYSIKDPANGSYNYNAPGAHRYKIDLVLKFLETTAGANFIELVTYLDGEILKKVDTTQYSDLIKLFAQRTYDESGNYIVKPFDISFRDGDATKFYADVGSGKAYVFGYEYETKFKDIVEVSTARTTAEYVDAEIDNYFGNYIVGDYDPQTAGSRLNSLFSSVQASIGEKSLAYWVYGNTAPLTDTNLVGLSGSIFSALLTKVEPNDDKFSTQGATMQFKAYLSNLQYFNPTGTMVGGMNLYLFSQETNVSEKLLSNITLYRTSNPTSTSRLPKFSDITSQDLLYPINGNTPSTMVEHVEKVSYIHDVFRGFVVDAANPYPSIALAQGVDFNWCFHNGFVPDGNDIALDDTDGYYIVYESGNAMTRGTVIKIVGNSTSVSAGQTKVTAKITQDGDYVEITSALPFGSYYLVGKSKNVADQILNASNKATKIRTKTLTTASETITETTNTLNTLKRNIRKNTAGSIYDMYFVLDQADVFRVNTITDRLGNDISNEFMFDSGQRDAVYLFGRLYVKPDYYSKYDNGQSFQINVSYSYFSHSGYGPFLAESYAGISYENIPSFISPYTGKSINLANAADFRYVAKIVGYASFGATAGSTASIVSSGSFNRPVVHYSNGFVPGQSSLMSTHTAYLPRIDKVVVGKNIAADELGDVTTLRIIQGNANDSPTIPEDLGDSMTLFVLSVPAYTFNAKDVKAQSIANNRFTMKDIGTISKRVDNLEQYAILNDLELSVANRNILNSFGDSAIKKAILVDTFEGHSVGDVMNLDYRCAIDVERGELKPSFSSNAYGFAYNLIGQGLTLTTDNILCSTFTSTTAMSQEKASTTTKVNPFGLPNWVGNIKITPHSDYWYDTETRPLIKSNDTGINDAWLISNMNDSAGHGSQWNDWESIWTGISVELTEAESKKNADFFAKGREKENSNDIAKRWKTKESVIRYSDTVDATKDRYTADFRKKEYYAEVLPNTLLNKSIVPMMRAKTVIFDVYNMKPNTQVHVFFDNVNVNQYCTYNGSVGPFTTSVADGSIEGIVFNIPHQMFECGEKILRVVDDSSNDIANATTLAEGIFYSTGIKPENPLGISSIRPVEIRKQTPNSSKVVSNPLYRSKNINTTKFNQWIDPLAQTFQVGEGQYPNGFYLESVDLYFASKDADMPVTVEICPSISGIPHPTVVLPFSTVVKKPSAVTANATTPTATNFKFSTPVYLAPGEYSLVVRANTPKYSLFVANIGEIDLLTDDRISTTFPGGVLFKAQNSSEASGDANTDLMFKLNRCQFTAPTSQAIVLNNIAQATNEAISTIQPNLFAFYPPNVTTINTTLSLGSNDYNVTPGRNLNLDTVYNASSGIDMTINASNTSNGLATVMIDMDRTNAVVVSNIINSSESGTTIEQAPFSGKNDDTARYISKKVVLPEEQTALQLKVIMDAMYPKNTFIRVYALAYNSAQLTTDIGDQPYKRMAIEPTSKFYQGGEFTYSQNPEDFREISFTATPLNGEKFDTFAVKICMYSTDPVEVPVIKNLRIVAIE